MYIKYKVIGKTRSKTMSANLALAGQGYAEQIAKQTGTLQKFQQNDQARVKPVRKPDLKNIFNGNVVELPVKVQEPATVLKQEVKQNIFKAAQTAHVADSENYDAGKIGARFGGVA